MSVFGEILLGVDTNISVGETREGHTKGVSGRKKVSGTNGTAADF